MFMVSNCLAFAFKLKHHMKNIVSGEIHLMGKTGPLGTLGDGIAKVSNQTFLQSWFAEDVPILVW